MINNTPNPIQNTRGEKCQIRFVQSLPHLTDFQKFLLKQIQELQNSTVSKRSTSNVVAVQNDYGALKQSIINYYLQQKGRKKTQLDKMGQQITQLKYFFTYVKNCVQSALRSFQSSLSQHYLEIMKHQQSIEQQNSRLKTKIIEMGQSKKRIAQENRQLRINLKQWQQAKELRKLKQAQKNDPSLSKIETIIKNKLTQDSSNATTPLKEFNFNQFISKRPSGCSSAAGIYDSQQAKVKSAFRNSEVTNKKTHFNVSFASSFGQLNRPNDTGRYSKQKLKVYSVQP